MDNIHYMKDEKRIQSELAYCLNNFCNEGKQVVLTCKGYPGDIFDDKNGPLALLKNKLFADIHPFILRGEGD